MYQEKLEKIKSLKDEVKDFHPLLRSIFTNNQTIIGYEYTQGQHEMGADFVLCRKDQTLGDIYYTGVIVKIGDISQDIQTIKRQIEECAVERPYDNGKKKIFLSEIWIVCNGKVSHGAERRIHDEYRAKNIKFIDADKVLELTDQFYPHFWNEIPEKIGYFLKDSLETAITADSFSASIPNLNGIDIMPNLSEIEKTIGKRKIRSSKKIKITNIENIVKECQISIIEGGMGSGKSTIFRKFIKKICQPQNFNTYRYLPKIISYKEISNEIKKIENLYQEIKCQTENKENEIILFIDAIDEDKNHTKFLEVLNESIDLCQKHKDLKIVFSSRNIWSIEESEQILNKCRRFKVLPLTLDQIFKVVQKSCENTNLSERLRGDLHKSSLIRALPRTPMSAVLLSRVLMADSKEIPQTLPELYSKYIELSLGRWDVSKGLLTEQEYPIISTVISNVAKFMLENSLGEISQTEVLEMISNYIKNRRGLPSSQEIYEKITKRSEIIFINNKSNTFSFRHKSFAEFLYAKNLQDRFGKNADILNPFDGYWLGSEYFYLGLIKDAGERIEKISNIIPSSEKENLLKIINFSSLMLAAHQTEYHYIESCVYKICLELTDYFFNVSNGNINSPLKELPELQLLGILAISFQSGLEYPFFRDALDSAQIQCQIDDNLDDEKKIICSFFIDCVRAGLKCDDAFKFLTEKKYQNLPWVIKLGIHHVSQDEDYNPEHIKRFTKKIDKSQKGNIGLQQYIQKLYSGSQLKRLN